MKHDSLSAAIIPATAGGHERQEGSSNFGSTVPTSAYRKRRREAEIKFG